MAEECSDDDDDKAVIRKIRKRVLKKMTMFKSIVQEWGFELPAGNISDRAMIKYTDLLMAAASGESEIQAVLEPDENNHHYKKWIDSLASKKFEDSAYQIEELLDKLTVVVDQRRASVCRNNLPQSNEASMLLIQVHFLLMWQLIKSSKTVKSSGYESGGDGPSLDNLRDVWSGLHTTEFDFERLCNALGPLSDLEKVANLKVDNSGVLKGLHMDDITWAAEHLIFQDGCLEFFRD
ncbi:bifunctional TH2 protein, mitochondrial-like [Bidens hawaiensis]|uniref:bifunctional TH2 protein, mitochondrial-like n=1 Tax=Bidens hawaiensis TaxID=980011 RepID=UPI00404AA72F